MESENNSFNLDEFIHEEEEEETETVRLRWQDAETRLLLELYRIKVKLVGPGKKFKKKENLWPFICEKLKESGFEFTAKQVGC